MQRTKRVLATGGEMGPSPGTTWAVIWSATLFVKKIIEVEKWKKNLNNKNSSEHFILTASNDCVFLQNGTSNC